MKKLKAGRQKIECHPQVKQEGIDPYQVYGDNITPDPEGGQKIYWNIVVLLRINLCESCQRLDLDYVITVTSVFNYLFFQAWQPLSFLKSHGLDLFVS